MQKAAMTQMRRGREGLSSIEEIVEAALSLVEREGLRALTMRRLAEELGLGVMTLYTYVATKSELLDLMVDQTLGSLGVASSSDDGWQERVVRLMTELHDRLLARPAVARITLERERQLPVLDPFREAVLSALNKGGFLGRDAVDAFTTLTAYVLGYVTIQRARSGSQVENERRRLATLPRDRYPTLVASARHYAAHVSAGAFELGLRSLLYGLSAKLRKRGSKSR
jgi:AcrR family transcriptional regulator